MNPMTPPRHYETRIEGTFKPVTPQDRADTCLKKRRGLRMHYTGLAMLSAPFAALLGYGLYQMYLMSPWIIVAGVGFFVWISAAFYLFFNGLNES